VKLLLDTHIWLWSFLQPERLSRRVAREIQRADNELWLSPISVWELGILCDKGRVKLTQQVETWVDAVFRAVPMHEAPLTAEIALATRGIRLPHRDHADRFLAATAKVLGLTLVTADQRLLACRGITVLVNR
jgi:PIN domain nuclease of toxin-antitoxin system